MTSAEQQITSCNTYVIVENTFNFGCPIEITAQTLGSSVYLQSKYVPPQTSGTFYQCLGFKQTGNLNYL